MRASRALKTASGGGGGRAGRSDNSLPYRGWEGAGSCRRFDATRERHAVAGVI
jgi:hypothetical protein